MPNANNGDSSEVAEALIEDIPDWMPKHEDSGNFKLVNAIGLAIERLDEDIETASKATTVQEAETIAQLEVLGELVSLPSKRNEGVEKYRSRLIAKFQQMTNEATAPELINNTATILDVEPTELWYKRPRHGVNRLSVPGFALDRLFLTNTEFAGIVRDLIAAGFDITILRQGDFTYITPSRYKNDNHNPRKGYDGLNSSGNPKGEGGTYAGIIE